MFQRLRIKNFRLFDDLKIDWLSRINLLGGRNNSGKTTVLEALFLLSGGGNPELVQRITVFRGITQVEGLPSVVPETYWKPLFGELEMNRPIEISGKHTQHGRLSLEITIERPDTIQLPRRPPEAHGAIANLQDGQSLSESWELRLRTGARASKNHAEGRLRVTQTGLEMKPPTSNVRIQGSFLSARKHNLQEDAVRLGQLRARKQGDLLTKALQVVEPRLESVEDISASGVPMIWGDIGLRELVPLSSMGEGMTQVARLVLAMSSAPGGIVLVDEIENGIHHSIMNKLWTVVAEAARQFDTQVFATTHSFECLKAAHGALSSEDWRYHRLDRTKEGVSCCVTYDTEEVEAAIRHGLEVR